MRDAYSNNHAIKAVFLTELHIGTLWWRVVTDRNNTYVTMITILSEPISLKQDDWDFYFYVKEHNRNSLETIQLCASDLGLRDFRKYGRSQKIFKSHVEAKTEAQTYHKWGKI